MNMSVPIQRGAANTSDALPILMPAQQMALDRLTRLSDAAPLVFLGGGPGRGKSTILRAFCSQQGGTLLTNDDVMAVARQSVELGDDALTKMLEAAFAHSDLVVVEDFQSFFLQNMRNRDLQFQLIRRLSFARAQNKRLVGGAHMPHVNWMISSSPHRAWKVEVPVFESADYHRLLSNRLGEAVSGINIERLHRHASGLNGHELVRLCDMLAPHEVPTTADAITILDQHILTSNTRIEEVEELKFEELPGAEHIAAKLETHVVMPLLNADLAQRLDLKPKRGVLLYGPPGTGKTSIGRALAHRMGGKFFLIDGTIVTEPPADFFGRVRSIIAQAQENAPCVLFIDDADVLFGIIHISGFARFLLTLLDGMESESAGKVCVMMTAMDVTKVPSAILRSGRVELWLETRPPSAEVRAEILKKWIGKDLPGHEEIDYLMVAEHAEDFTPADLRRVTADARAHYAADEIAGRPIQRADTYLSRAVLELIATRARMADNLRDDSLRVGKMVVRAKYAAGIGGLAQTSVNCSVGGW